MDDSSRIVNSISVKLHVGDVVFWVFVHFKTHHARSCPTAISIGDNMIKRKIASKAIKKSFILIVSIIA